MSVIVGFTLNDERYLGGDTRISSEDGHYNNAFRKVFKRSTGLIGFTGEIAALSKILEILKDTDNPSEVESKEFPKGVYECLFFSRTGRNYRIQDEGTVAPLRMSGENIVVAAGDGYRYAMGAIYGACRAKGLNLRKASTKQQLWLIRTGIRAAMHYNYECGGSVQIVSMKVSR